MSSPTGAHGEADATKQENEQQPQSTASTDATLNARALRLAPPLVITAQDVDQAVSILAKIPSDLPND